MQLWWVLFGQAYTSSKPAGALQRHKFLYLIIDSTWDRLLKFLLISSSDFGLLFCRWKVKMPEIVDKSIKLLSDGGLGMATFSLGMSKHP